MNISPLIPLCAGIVALVLFVAVFVFSAIVNARCRKRIRGVYGSKDASKGLS